MKMIDLPLMARDSGHTYPDDGNCPACGTSFKDSQGFAYISAGSLLTDAVGENSLITFKMESFFGIGFHGNDIDVRDSVHAEIIKDLSSEQFDICFCSFRCLKMWLVEVFDKLQDELDLKRRSRLKQGKIKGDNSQ